MSTNLKPMPEDYIRRQIAQEKALLEYIKPHYTDNEIGIKNCEDRIKHLESYYTTVIPERHF